MIPEEKSAPVSRGLREAFGVEGFEDIRRMTKGHTSALVFRIVAKGTAYLLRIMMRKDTMIAPTRQFSCMNLAAEAGIAPYVWYSNVDDGVSITDFVEEVPFAREEALVRMPKTLRALHALPPFPRLDHQPFNTTCTFLLNKDSGAEEFMRKFRAAKVISDSEYDELFASCAQLARAYRQSEEDMVSSHNDLFKPDNILFDGSRVWLVDWEAAFLNDRYADLAVVANLLVTDDLDEQAYLHEYFGQPPDDYQQARFFLMRQISHAFYAMGFLFLGSLGEPTNQTGKTPAFTDFQRRFWSGELTVVDKQMKIVYGRVHLEQLFNNVRRPRFEDAVRVLTLG